MSATQTATPGKTTTWQVDPAHTHVEFAVRHLMISTVRGRFSDVADVDKYPTMRFTGRRIEHPSRDTNQYRVVGDLTLHGVTKEILLDVTLEGLIFVWLTPKLSRRPSSSGTARR